MTCSSHELNSIIPVGMESSLCSPLESEDAPKLEQKKVEQRCGFFLHQSSSFLSLKLSSKLENIPAGRAPASSSVPKLDHYTSQDFICESYMIFGTTGVFVGRAQPGEGVGSHEAPPPINRAIKISGHAHHHAQFFDQPFSQMMRCAPYTKPPLLYGIR